MCHSGNCNTGRFVQYMVGGVIHLKSHLDELPRDESQRSAVDKGNQEVPVFGGGEWASYCHMPRPLEWRLQALHGYSPPRLPIHHLHAGKCRQRLSVTQHRWRVHTKSRALNVLLGNERVACHNSFFVFFFLATLHSLPAAARHPQPPPPCAGLHHRAVGRCPPARRFDIFFFRVPSTSTSHAYLL